MNVDVFVDHIRKRDQINYIVGHILIFGLALSDVRINLYERKFKTSIARLKPRLKPCDGCFDAENLFKNYQK